MRIEGNDPRLAAAAAAQIQQTGLQQTLAPKVPQRVSDSGSKGETVQSIVGDKVSIKVDLPQHTVDTLRKMGNISDFLNSMAVNLRQTSEGLSAANAITEQMKASLDKIIKNFPPYPLESRERMEQMMQYASLQKQIMSMVVPNPPQPVFETVKHLLVGLTSGIGGVIQTPMLPLNAPDDHVAAAARQLDVISSQIGLIKDSMRSSTEKG